MSSSDKLTKFRRLRQRVYNWNDKRKRREFIRQLVSLISDWKSELPDLRDVLRPREIDQLLIDAVGIIFTDKCESDGIKIVAFVVSTGYRDEPTFDRNNRPLLHRRSPLLHVGSYLPSISNARETVRELFKIYDKFGVNYIGHNDMTHFHVACAYGLKDVAEKFLDSRQDVNCRDGNNDTPLLMATLQGEKEVAKLLLRRRANVAMANRQKKTPLHFICQKYRGDHDLVESLFKVNDDMRQGMRVNAQDNKGNTALHLILECGREIEKTVELLLRRGADPTLANAEREVPLLKIFWRGEASLMKTLFKAIDGHCWRRRRQTYPVNFQDRQGNTALHYVLERHRNSGWFAWLLRKGADPNLVNNEGISAVDLVCSSWRYGADDKMFRSLVKHCNDTRRTLKVNARDKSGGLLLNWALENRDKTKVEWLLRTGVDPNLADEHGSTALHVISQQRNDYGFAELLFKICDENRRTVRVDAKDKLGRTPIEYAVANFYPNIVAALLDRGASLVWPTGSHFDELYRQRNDPPFEYKFTRLIGALAVMECLENRNYEFERGKALRIMKYFYEFKMFADLENDQYDVDTFPSSSAKSMMIKPNLSLHDLIQMSPQEAWERLTYQDCYDYWSSINVCAFSLRSRVISARVICEKMLIKFFLRPWAVISYLELVRYRLPEECCEMIIDPLANRDLLNICLAARDSNVDSEEQRIRVSVPETKSRVKMTIILLYIKMNVKSNNCS